MSGFPRWAASSSSRPAQKPLEPLWPGGTAIWRANLSAPQAVDHNTRPEPYSSYSYRYLRQIRGEWYYCPGAAKSKVESRSRNLKPMPVFPVAPPPRDDVDQAPIAQVEAAPGEIELDAVVRAQSCAPQVVKRLTTLEDCLWAAVDALGKLPEKARELLGADTIIKRAKFLLRGDLEPPEQDSNETSGQHARTEPPDQ